MEPQRLTRSPAASGHFDFWDDCFSGLMRNTWRRTECWERSYCGNQPLNPQTSPKSEVDRRRRGAGVEVVEECPDRLPFRVDLLTKDDLSPVVPHRHLLWNLLEMTGAESFGRSPMDTACPAGIQGGPSLSWNPKFAVREVGLGILSCVDGTMTPIQVQALHFRFWLVCGTQAIRF